MDPELSTGWTGQCVGWLDCTCKAMNNVHGVLIMAFTREYLSSRVACYQAVGFCACCSKSWRPPYVAGHVPDLATDLHHVPWGGPETDQLVHDKFAAIGVLAGQ